MEKIPTERRKIEKVTQSIEFLWKKFDAITFRF